MIPLPHIYLSPASVFYVRMALLAIGTAVVAVFTNRWLMGFSYRKMLKREFVKQLLLIHRFGKDI